VRQRRHNRFRNLCIVILILLSGIGAAKAEEPPPRSSLKTVEGKVLVVGRIAGEGGIEIVQVEIAPDGDREHPLRILLAPAEAMASIGFTIEPGDQLKVKYFVGEEGNGKAHKVWQGGQGRMHHGQGAGRGGSP